MSSAERYVSLMRAARAGVSEGWDAHVVASAVAAAATGDGAALVDSLGLEPEQVATVLSELFPALTEMFARLRGLNFELRAEPDELRLRELLTGHASQGNVSNLLAALVARGVLRPLPLWRELGLSNPGELEWLMQRHFAGLAARNTHDMGWKAFLCDALRSNDGGFCLATLTGTDDAAFAATAF